MYHFFVQPEQVNEKEIVIYGEDVNHIGNVLRMKPKEKVLISAAGMDYLCEIDKISREEVYLSILKQNEDSMELPVEITLYQGMPKAEKMELIIQKAVELGASRIVPVMTRRVIVKLDEKKARIKVARWQAIAEAAAKQSKRSTVPEVTFPMSFVQALEESSSSNQRFIPYELASGMENTRKLLKAVVPGDEISIFIGPEGGFEEEEIQMAIERKVKPITLGRRILRTETAGFVVLSNLMIAVDVD